jgi:hypothetical protein
MQRTSPQVMRPAVRRALEYVVAVLVALLGNLLIIQARW